MPKRYVQLKCVFIGAACTICVLLALAGQQPSQSPPPAPVGTYQVSAWAHADGRHGAFVIDTRTGEVISVVGRTINFGEGPEGVYKTTIVRK